MYDFGENVSTPMVLAVQKSLFDVNKYDELLDENRSAIFHSVVQTLLFTTKRSRSNL